MMSFAWFATNLVIMPAVGLRTNVIFVAFPQLMVHVKLIVLQRHNPFG